MKSDESMNHCRVRLLGIPWTVVLQALLSMEFSRQEYWSELPFPLLLLTFYRENNFFWKEDISHLLRKLSLRKEGGERCQFLGVSDPKWLKNIVRSIYFLSREHFCSCYWHSANRGKVKTIQIKLGAQCSLQHCSFATAKTQKQPKCPLKDEWIHLCERRNKTW